MKKLLITIAAVAALTACSPAESGSVKTNPTLTPSPITSPTTTPTKECLNAGCVTAMPTEQYNKIRTPKPATITKKPKAKKTPVKTNTTKPKPRPTKTTKPKPSTPAFFKNCTEMRKAGKAPAKKGTKYYRKALDRDNDGLACEVN